MAEPSGFEKRMRGAIFIALAMLVIIAPLIGVYAFAPLLFAYWLQPYELSVAISVMLAEAVAIASITFLVIRSRK